MTDNDTFERDRQIVRFKDIEAKAYQKRLEYLTVEVLPDCDFKTLKINKLLAEQEVIMQEFNDIMVVMITNYGAEVLQELI